MADGKQEEALREAALLERVALKGDPELVENFEADGRYREIFFRDCRPVPQAEEALAALFVPVGARTTGPDTYSADILRGKTDFFFENRDTGIYRSRVGWKDGSTSFTYIDTDPAQWRLGPGQTQDPTHRLEQFRVTQESFFCRLIAQRDLLQPGARTVRMDRMVPRCFPKGGKPEWDTYPLFLMARATDSKTHLMSEILYSGTESKSLSSLQEAHSRRWVSNMLYLYRGMRSGGMAAGFLPYTTARTLALNLGVTSKKPRLITDLTPEQWTLFEKLLKGLYLSPAELASTGPLLTEEELFILYHPDSSEDIEDNIPVEERLAVFHDETIDRSLPMVI